MLSRLKINSLFRVFSFHLSDWRLRVLASNSVKWKGSCWNEDNLNCSDEDDLHYFDNFHLSIDIIIPYESYIFEFDTWFESPFLNNCADKSKVIKDIGYTPMTNFIISSLRKIWKVEIYTIYNLINLNSHPAAETLLLRVYL